MIAEMAAMSEPKTNKQPIKVDRDLYRKLSLIAAIRDLSIADVASELLRPYVENEYRMALEELDTEKRRT